MKFLIIAGPYEADLLRRAALQAQCEALAIEPGDTLPGWIAAARPDVIVISALAVPGGVARAAQKIRAIPGGDVPLVVLCKEEEVAACERVATLVLRRPIEPAQVIAKTRLLARPRKMSRPGAVGINPGTVAEAIAVGEAPTGVTNGVAPQSVTKAAPSVPNLKPLSLQRDRLGSARPQPAASGAPWVKQIAASIDETLDAEMAVAFSQVGAAPLYPEAGGENGAGVMEVPAELLHTILADGAGVVDGAGRLPLSGDLHDWNLASILGCALQDGITGRCRFRNGDIEKSIFFEAGRPVLAVSNETSDRMVQMLVRVGTLSEEQAARAVDVATDSGRRMGAVLVEMGFIKSSELLPAVRQHYEEVVVSLFPWRQGRFSLDVGATADPRRVRLLQHPASLVLEGIARGFDNERVKSALGVDSQVLRLDSHTGAPDILLEINGCDANLSRLPVLFDGVRTLGEIQRVSGQPPELLRRVALTLRVFGLLRQGRGSEGPGADVVPALMRDQEIDRERIAGRMKLVRDGTYYEILGVGPDASVDEVLQARKRLLREISPGVVGAGLSHELAVELTRLRAVIEEAAHILSQPILRQEYRANHLGKHAGPA